MHCNGVLIKNILLYNIQKTLIKRDLRSDKKTLDLTLTESKKLTV